MKNLILTCSMILCFGYASAQDTPKSKQPKNKTDSVYSKKTKQKVEKNSSTYKTDTIHQKNKHTKTKTKKTSGVDMAPQRKDSVN